MTDSALFESIASSLVHFYDEDCYIHGTFSVRNRISRLEIIPADEMPDNVTDIADWLAPHGRIARAGWRRTGG